VQATVLHPGVYDTGLLRNYLGRIPGGGVAARVGTSRAKKAGPVVAELAVGRRTEDLNGLYFHKAARAAPSAAARDTRAQERLWSWSAEATGLEVVPAGGEAGAGPEPEDARELGSALADSPEMPLR